MLVSIHLACCNRLSDPGLDDDDDDDSVSLLFSLDMLVRDSEHIDDDVDDEGRTVKFRLSSLWHRTLIFSNSWPI